MGSMRMFFVLFGVLTLVSCDRFTNKSSRITKMTEEKMKHLSLDDVDQFPKFENCDETASKIDQRICFEETLLTHLSATINQFEFILNADVDKELYIDFLVDHTGEITILKIEKDAKINTQMPEFDGIITRSLRNLPELAAAHKQGIPVRAKFRIPIALQIK